MRGSKECKRKEIKIQACSRSTSCIEWKNKTGEQLNHTSAISCPCCGCRGTIMVTMSG